MRLFRALCATLGALLIVSTLPSGAYAADGPTLSETFVLSKDGQLVDTLTIIDPSRTMSKSAGKPYAGKSSDQHVEFVTRDDVTCAICSSCIRMLRGSLSSPSRIQASSS